MTLPRQREDRPDGIKRIKNVRNTGEMPLRNAAFGSGGGHEPQMRRKVW